MTSGDVTVVIPTYNRAVSVVRAIDSALRQTALPGEIAVVDDGSTDGTSAALADWAPPVRVIRQANSGPSAARNRGIREAQTGWIAFLDADDEWAPEKLERQVAIMRRRPDLRWCCGNCEWLLDTGQVVPAKTPAPLGDVIARDGGIAFFEALRRGLCFITPGFVVAREVFEEVGVFDTSLRVGEDWDLWWRIGMRYPQIGYCVNQCCRCSIGSAGSLTAETRDRTQRLQNLCDNLDRASAHGSDVAEAFWPHARKLARNLQLRHACGEIVIAPDTLRRARELFPQSAIDRALFALIKNLPASIGHRIISRLVSSFWPTSGY